MITIRPLTAADIPFGMDLKQQAGWNQTEADWRRALELEPNGCFVGLIDDTPAATLTACLFGPVAWIAMVLTRAEFRGRGLATALLKQSLAFAESRGATSVRLDATPLGKPVYEKLGFTVDGEVTRFYGRPQRPAQVRANSEIAVVPWLPQHLEPAARLDALATGNDRRRLLACVQRDWPDAAFTTLHDAEVTGYCLARRGSRAPQLGPCITANDVSGTQLLAAALSHFANQNLYVDVPHQNHAAYELALQTGLAAERSFYRMTRGKPITEQNECIWATYGPEKG